MMIDPKSTPLFQIELDRLGEELVKAFRDVLEDQDKVATGKTKQSIRAETDLMPLSISVFGSEGIYNIEKGREAFEVLLEDDDPDLLEWMDARNIPRSAVKSIAMSIYFNPLPPVPITGMVVKDKLDGILKKQSPKILSAFSADVGDIIRQALTIAYQKSKIDQNGSV